MRTRLCGVLLCGCLGAAAASGQAKQGAQPYTLRINARAVLTDVTVTNKAGKPVRGLKRSDFEIFDNGRPQDLTSFTEHVAGPAPAGASEHPVAGIYSNANMLHPPPVVNVLLLDTTTIGIVDQMYLYEQLTRFVQKLPAGEPLAVFCRSGDMTLWLQDFTSDHALLQKAIRRAIPRLQQTDAPYESDYDTLRQMAFYLSQMPGRKNVLWFSGGSNLYLNDLDGNFGFATIGSDPPWRDIYDVLEEERIVLYPIDARGLTVGFSRSMADQQMLMRDDARATGGSAKINTNGLAKAAEEIVSSDGDFYTLTYSPDDLRANGKWHTVEVRLRERAGQLTYRRGYYDDGHLNPAEPIGGTRQVLRADGRTGKAPSDRSAPIPFEAYFRPIAPESEVAGTIVAPKRGKVAYNVRCEMLARDVLPQSVKENEGLYNLGSAVLVYDHFGNPVGHNAWRVTLEANQKKVRSIPHATVGFNERIDLPKGEDYLYLVVWDSTTGRMGLMTLRLNVKKPQSP